MPADVCSAARMRPEPALPAFSMAPPARVAQALLQYLALLLSALRQRLHEAKILQSVALSTVRRAERTVLERQQQLTTNWLAAAVDKELSHAPYQDMHGRTVPAGLPLQLKLTEPTVKDLVGEFVAVAPFGSACIRHIGWAMDAASRLHRLLQGLVEDMPLLKLFELLCWKGAPSVRTRAQKRGLCVWACAEREMHMFALLVQGKSVYVNLR